MRHSGRWQDTYRFVGVHDSELTDLPVAGGVAVLEGEQCLVIVLNVAYVSDFCYWYPQQYILQPITRCVWYASTNHTTCLILWNRIWWLRPNGRESSVEKLSLLLELTVEITLIITHIGVVFSFMGPLLLDCYYFHFLMSLKKRLTFLSLSNPVLQHIKFYVSIMHYNQSHVAPHNVYDVTLTSSPSRRDIFTLLTFRLNMASCSMVVTYGMSPSRWQ